MTNYEIEPMLKESTHTMGIQRESKITYLESQCDPIDPLTLWSNFIGGDEDAFIGIYNLYFKDLCDFGVQFAPVCLVEDAVQDMFIDLRKKRNVLPFINKSLRSFLFQCLKRRLFNMLKKQKKIQNGIMSEHCFEIVPHHESVIILNQEHKEKLEKLHKAMADLNAKHREAIYYYFYKGMGYEEVQELLGFQDVKSARNLIYKVIKVLRKSFLLFL